MSDRSTSVSALPPACEHLARLGQPVEHAAGDRRFQRGIVQRRLQTIDPRLRCCHRRIGLGHAALRLCHAGHGAFHAGLICIELVARNETAPDQFLGTLQRLAGQRGVSLRLAHPGPRLIHGPLRLDHLRLRRPQLGTQIIGIESGKHRPGIDPISPHADPTRPAARQSWSPHRPRSPPAGRCQKRNQPANRPAAADRRRKRPPQAAPQ